MQARTTARPRALITGASAGIGEAFAERLAGDAHDLVLVARRRDRLAALAERLRGASGVDVEVLAADLTNPKELRVVEDRLASDEAMEVLVNSAGFGGYMPFLELAPDRAEELIRLHVVALTRLTRAALPGMVARGRGAVINVSSLLAFSAGMPAPPLPFRATYAACKAYINAFSETLQGEVAAAGVTIQALCPGVVRTEFHTLARRDLSQMPAAAIMEPDAVVRASLAALHLGEVICIPALDDPTLLEEYQAHRDRLFGTSRSGAMSPRYGTRKLAP